jgi:hypothetical protein
MHRGTQRPPALLELPSLVLDVSQNQSQVQTNMRLTVLSACRSRSILRPLLMEAFRIHPTASSDRPSHLTDHPTGCLQCRWGSCPLLSDRHHLGSARLPRGRIRIRILALIPIAYLCLQQVRGAEISVISAILARSIRTGQAFGAAGQSSTGSGGSAGSFGHGVHQVQRGLVADPCT